MVLWVLCQNGQRKGRVRTARAGSESGHEVSKFQSPHFKSRPTWPHARSFFVRFRSFFDLTTQSMGFNDLMHPRNIYRKSPPDFKILAEKFDYFRKFAKETKPGRFTLNFKDPEALRALTCALLESDFGLKLSIPLDRLIPTVPLRLNYILWIEDLLACLPDNQRHATVRGFDIGKD